MTHIGRLVSVLAFLLAIGDALAQDWQLVWSDEFDTDGFPDSTKWNYDLGGGGWGNLELQFYTDRLDNARVESGTLIIEAREENYQGHEYTSSRLVTRDRASWKYGRFEARLRLPPGQGFWPAFWMLPTDSPYGIWPSSGEIDIVEYLGSDTDRAYGTLHYGGGDLGLRSTGGEFDLASGSFADEFHTFALEWEPRVMRWYIDDELYLTQLSWSSARGPYPAPFNHPFHILLNVTVGGNWPGPPDETTAFPQRMEVDFVRVYQDAQAYPYITLDAPVDGTTIEAGSTLPLVAEAVDSGAVERVEFLQDGGVLTSIAEPPYTFDIEDVVDGCYSLSARAIDDAGYSTESDPANIIVGSGCPDGSRWPFQLVPSSVPGRIEAEYYDLGGLSVAYFDVSRTNDGNGIRQAEGVDLRQSRDNGGGFDISDIFAREWVTYSIRVAETGRYVVVARAASDLGGQLRLSVDGEDLFGDAGIDPSGGASKYSSTTLGEINLEAGMHTLRLDMRSSGFSLNWLNFKLVEPTLASLERPAGAVRLEVSPNPAEDRVRATYQLPKTTRFELLVVDMLGRPVARPAWGTHASGEFRDEIDLSGLASGVYLLVLKTENTIQSRRIVVID